MATTTTPAGTGSHAKENIDREVENLKGDISKLTDQVATLLSTPAAPRFAAPSARLTA